MAERRFQLPTFPDFFGQSNRVYKLRVRQSETYDQTVYLAFTHNQHRENVHAVVIGLASSRLRVS